jgi:hypothetical protein
MPARTYSTDVYLTCPCPDCVQVPQSLTAPVASLRASRATAGVQTR